MWHTFEPLLPLGGWDRWTGLWDALGCFFKVPQVWVSTGFMCKGVPWCEGAMEEISSQIFSPGAVSSEHWALLRYCKVSKVSKWGIAKYPSAVQCRDVAAVWYERAKCRSRGFWAVHRMRSVDLWHNVQCTVYTLCLSRHCVTLECSILWRAPGVSHCVSGSYQVCQIISTSQAGTRGRSGREKGGDVFRHLDLIVFHFIMCFTSSCVSP